MGKTLIRSKKSVRSWMAAITKLFAEMEKWAAQQDWLVARKTKALEEDSGTFEVPELWIKIPGGTIVAEVIGKDIIGADGRVDLYCFPTFDRFVLLWREGKWVIKTDSLMRWPKPWGPKAFVEMAELLIHP